MAIVPMQKVAVLAYRPLREEVLDVLQDAGVLHISEAEPEMRVDHSEVNYRIAELHFAINILKSIAPKKVLAAALAPHSIEAILASLPRTDVRGIVDELHALEKSDTDASAVLKEAQTLVQTLVPWRKLPYRLDLQRTTTYTTLLLGVVPRAAFFAMKAALQEHLPRSTVSNINMEDARVMTAAVVWNDDIAHFEEVATTNGWIGIDLPHMHGAPEELLQKARTSSEEAFRKRLSNADQRMRLVEHLPDLLRISIYVQWLDHKQHAREMLKESHSLMTLLGWMPCNDVANLEQKLQKLSPAIAVVHATPSPEEEAPVLLKNLKLITPFESVTKLYGLPRAHEMDPTPMLAPFFILYYALCLTDSGYGAVLALVMTGAIWKTKKTIEQAPLLWLLLFSGIVSFFVGIPFGGWFGLSPDQVPAFLSREGVEGRLFLGQVWNLSQQSGINFLQYLALGLGITHIFFGMFLAGYHKWVHGQRAAALWQDFSAHLALAILLLMFFVPQEWKETVQTIFYGAIALLIWGKGYGTKWYLRPLMGFLSFANMMIGLLSNSLSYLRILALGLVTGAIAMAVDQVAVEMGKLFPWLFIRIPVVILIAVVGHTVSIALNALGSFIHSGRLQFIEFFGQFFEGGGKPFLPLSRSTSAH